MPKHSLAVMVIIETDDPRLDPDTIDVSTVDATIALRSAVIDNLASLTRVVMVLHEPEAHLMVRAHAIAARSAGLDHLFERPPSGYRAPDGGAQHTPGARRRG